MIRKINIKTNYYFNFVRTIIIILIANHIFGFVAISKNNDKIVVNGNGINVKINFNEILGDEKLSENIHIIDNEVVYSDKLANRINNIYSNKINIIKDLGNNLRFESLKLDFISNFNEKPEVKLKINKIDTLIISLRNNDPKLNEILDNYSFLNSRISKINNNVINHGINNEMKLDVVSKIIRNNNIYSFICSPIKYLTHNNENLTLVFYSDFEIIVNYNNIIKENNFDKNNINKLNKLNKRELSFLPNLVNNQHIDYFLNNISSKNLQLDNSKNKNKIQSNDDWYDVNKTYYEIIVDKNGIVRTQISELINLDNSLVNKNYKNLELIRNGISYPFYYKSDDELISENDEIYFYGLKAVGDSTNNDFYTNKQSYYLHYGSKINNNLLTNKVYQKTNNFTPNSNSFYSEIRIEKDSLFGHGNDFASVNHSFGEFWYWNILTTLNTNSKFNEAISIYPDYESNEKSLFGIEYKNFSYINRDVYNSEFVTTFIYNNIKSKLNNQTFVDTMFTGLVYDTLRKITEVKNINFGENKINLEIFKTLTDEEYLNNQNKNFYNIDANIGVDALIYNGFVKPIAINSSLISNKVAQSFDNNFKIYGFRNKDIIYIDTLNNKIAFPESEKGYLIKSNIGLDEININIEGIEDNVNLGDNEAKYLTQIKGIHLITVNNNSYRTELVTNLSQIQNNINNEFSIISINNNISNEIRNYLISKNSKLNFSNGSVSLLIFKNGELVGESSSNNKLFNFNFIVNEKGNSFSAELFNLKDKKEYFVAEDNSIIQNVNITSTNKSNLRDTKNQADAIIISHSNFLDGANKYANYYKEFNNINVKVIDVKDIYKEFGFGKESPFSIKSFLQYAFNNWESPKFTHLTIVGDASWDPIKRNPRFITNSWVPVYGWPTTDIWYGTLDGDYDYGLDVAVGRIPVNTNQEMLDYLEKIKEYNNYSTKKWMTNFINLTGGYNENNEKERFFGGREAWMETFKLYNLCISETAIRKNEGVTVGNNQGGEIREAINNGAFWVSYFGHASANNFDMDGWDVTTLNNKGKLTILSSLSCNTGAFAEPEFKYGRSEQYLLSPDRGFVGILASTFTGLGELVKGMQRSLFFNVSRDEVRERNLGMLLEYSKTNLTLPNNGVNASTPYIDAFYHNILLGDPLLDIKIGKEVDLFFEDETVEVTNIDGDEFLNEESDSVYVSKVFYNNGYKINDSIRVKISHTYNNITVDYFKTFRDVCLDDTLNFVLFTKNKAGNHKVKIELNYDDKVEESDYKNNIIEFQFNIFQKSLLAVEPLNNWAVDKDDPEFIFINPFIGNYKYEAKLIELINNNDEITENVIYNSNLEDFNVYENRVVFNPNFKLAENYYIFEVRFLDSSGAIIPTASWLSINFNTFEERFDDNIIFDFKDKFSLTNGDLVNTKVIDNKVVLSNNEYKYEVIGSRGNPEDPNTENRRYIKIQYNEPNGKEIVFQDNINTGFHTFKFPALYNEEEPVAKYFDTWGLQSVPQGLDATNQFINYLKDSLNDDEYIFITNCDEGARIMKEFCFDQPCFLDSVKVLFGDLGSKSAENYDWGYTFAYAFKKEGDNLVVITDSCILYNRISMAGSMIKGFSEGKYSLKTNTRAKKFNKITFETDIENPEINLTLVDKFDNIKEYKSENKFIKLGNNNYESSEELIDFINDSIVDFVDMEFKLEREKSYKNVYITNVKTEFDAIDEIAILKSKMALDSNNYLRGYKAILNIPVENLSNRFDTDIFKLKVSILNTSGRVDTIINVDGLQSNSIKDIKLEINTEFLSNVNDIFVELLDNNSNNKNNDLYQFNNIHTLKLFVKEDNIKPSIKVYSDGKILKDRDFVSQNPKLKIELSDNSPLNFNNTQIQVFLNRFIINQNNTLIYDYSNLVDEEIKSIFEFQWTQKFDFGENSILIRGIDRAGNADTLELSVFVSRDGFIKNVLCYPNPTFDATKIKFDVLMPFEKTNASMYIYDVLGNFVNKLDKEVNIGQNEFDWDLTNSFGNSVGNGKYYYFIKINSYLYFEDVSGSIIISK